jgi:chromate reductase, NAD(P)H dehydrogenase (quinone)
MMNGDECGSLTASQRLDLSTHKIDPGGDRSEICRSATRRILAISGSLRAASSNTTLLHAAAALAPENLEIVVYGGLANLPQFNPDLDNDAPAAVRDFRSQLDKSAGVIISSPEYAHGVPGALKNALDWLVASGELYDKPVALFSASPRATFAQASLTVTLSVMSVRLIEEASIIVPLLGKKVDVPGLIADPDMSHTIHSALVTLAHVICLFGPNRHAICR